MKYTLLTLALLFILSATYADEFVVRSFAPVPTDLSAIQFSHLDVNDEKCALIKVRTDLRNLAFDAGKNLAKDVEFKNGEYWLYVSPNEKRLTIIKEGFITLHYPIRIPIKSSKVYVLEITNKEKASAATGTMTINTAPQGALVGIKELSGLEKTTPATFQNYPAFPYSISISKDRYTTLDTILTLHPNESIVHNLELKPTWGDLIISVDPMDAEIYIDDAYFGIGNQELQRAESGINIGNHKIGVRKNGFYAQEQSVQITSGETQILEFVLVPQMGFLSLDVNPGDANIYLDKNKIDAVPYEDSLQVGAYILSIEREGYLSVSRSVEVKEKRRIDVYEELKHTTTVKIVSEPTGAEVYLNGNFLGKTPENILLSYGTNNIVLRKENYEDFIKAIEVSGSTQRFDFELKPNRHTIEVKSNPSGARVYVDQIATKETPAQLSLPYGEYRLMVEKKGYFRKRKLVQVNYDNQKFNFRLQKLDHWRAGFIRGADSWGGEITYIKGLYGVTFGYFQPPEVSFSETVDHPNINPDDYHDLYPVNVVGRETNEDSTNFKIVGKVHLCLNKAPTFSFVMGLAVGRIHYSEVFKASENYDGYSMRYIRKGDYYSVARKGTLKVSPVLGISVRLLRYLYANAEYWFLTEKGTAFFWGGGVCFPIK